MIEELLHFLGIPGTIISAVVMVVSAYHIKSILDVFTKVGLWVRVGGAAVIIVLLFAIFVPGFKVSVDVRTMIGAGGDLVGKIPWRAALDLIERISR